MASVRRVTRGPRQVKVIVRVMKAPKVKQMIDPHSQCEICQGQRTRMNEAGKFFFLPTSVLHFRKQ